ncbi:hypothetical protein [Novosphingobium kaempferiae]|uniref:hypothetical protein n=1 Tax=Novosphingobium kaempferiae TaxID=2896849 RepID=UPI001E377239|nr:hypothetical protein [Novosphingobium kaempferiae]
MTSIDKDDRGPDPANPSETPRGTFGDARPDQYHDPRTHGAQKPEKIDDRPMVSEVNPDKYPEKERRDGDVTR